jgi:hypothetical protein
VKRRSTLAFLQWLRREPREIFQSFVGNWRRNALAGTLHSNATVKSAVTPPPWNDWLTNSFFRIRVSSAAAEKLRRLPVETQRRLRQMLQDITELADLTPPNVAHTWMSAGTPPLLTLQLHRVHVRYAITEESRTLSIEHVIVLDDEEPLGQTG